MYKDYYRTIPKCKIWKTDLFTNKGMVGYSNYRIFTQQSIMVSCRHKKV